MDLYTEPPDAGNAHRARLLDQIHALIAARQEGARAEREAAFARDLSSPEAYARSVGAHRTRFRALLGWPLTSADRTTPRMRRELVAEDDLGSVSRVWVQALPGLETYGLLFLPRSSGPHPLVISQHGGGGTPELCSGLFDSANYNDMSRRVLRRGCAVYAPQLPMWVKDFGPPPDMERLDRQLKQLGGSMAALDVLQIQQGLTAVAALPEIDASRVGMIGLSFGGFYTLLAAALDTRIRVALTSCFFNDRHRYDLPSAVWTGAASSFLDPEIAALVCPRPLCIELGRRDELFATAAARGEVDRVRTLYDALGIGPRFRYHEHDGAHELDRQDGGIDFLTRWLMA